MQEHSNQIEPFPRNGSVRGMDGRAHKNRVQLRIEVRNGAEVGWDMHLIISKFICVFSRATGSAARRARGEQSRPAGAQRLPADRLLQGPQAHLSQHGHGKLWKMMKTRLQTCNHVHLFSRIPNHLGVVRACMRSFNRESRHHCPSASAIETRFSLAKVIADGRA